MPHPRHVVAAVNGTAADHSVTQPQWCVLQHDEVDVLAAQRGDERIVQPGVVESVPRGWTDTPRSMSLCVAAVPAATEPKT